MKNTVTNLLNNYYDNLAVSDAWQSSISDEFIFKGTGVSGSSGKAAYIEVIKRFRRLFENVSAKEIIASDGKACVIANYNLISPKGNKLNFDIVEIWEITDEKLRSLTIYYDTVTFNKFVSD
jgi:ketosteroid isomerase-like protein